MCAAAMLHSYSAFADEVFRLKFTILVYGELGANSYYKSAPSSHLSACREGGCLQGP